MNHTKTLNTSISSNLSKQSDKVLGTSVGLLFITILLGQWIFVSYLIVAYISPGLEGDFNAWNAHMPKGYVEGQTMSNVATITHVSLAVIIMGLGPLQLLPLIRKHAPRFHRWNGRVYMTTAVISSVVGLYMIATRGVIGGTAQYIGITLDAILIILFSCMTLRLAIKRDIKAHRRWALRLFMVVSAVWFYRVGLMFWLAINGGPVGINLETFEGPFVNFIAFAQYLIPLAILELYFFSENQSGQLKKYLMAGLLVLAAAVVSFGVFAATNGMWFPETAPF